MNKVILMERLKEDYDIEDRELFDKIKKGAVTQSNAREIKRLIKDTFSLAAQVPIPDKIP